MRGTDQQQNHIFSYLSPETRVRKDHPLRAIRAMVDQVLAQLSRRFAGMYATVGRASFCTVFGKHDVCAAELQCPATLDRACDY
jgi:hypothetical protein